MSFSRINKIMKALITLHLYIKYPTQEILEGEIEHIFPKKWQNTNYNGWNKKDANQYLEQIGNKMLLEKGLNIEADGYFGRKKEKYKESKFLEAQDLGKYPKDDWLKENIKQRNEEIFQCLYKFFKENI